MILPTDLATISKNKKLVPAVDDMADALPLRTSSYTEALAAHRRIDRPSLLSLDNDDVKTPQPKGEAVVGEEGHDSGRKNRIEVSHSWGSAILMTWVFPVISAGWHRPLTADELPELKPRMQAVIVGDKVSIEER